MLGQTILVVDDDKKIVELVSLYLKNEGFRVLPAYSGRQALEKAREHGPDLIVLDLMLPELDGMDVCRLLRLESDVPILMLTARTADEDILRGFDCGADDYLTKPFNPREFVARVHAILRRVESEGAGEEERRDLVFGDLVISLLRHEVTLAGEVVNLTPTEFRILAAMAREPGRAFPRLELLHRAFGQDYGGLERSVDVHIMNIRRKVEPDPRRPQYIITVPGVGYRFEAHHAE